jgi:hypothetical protein
MRKEDLLVAWSFCLCPTRVADLFEKRTISLRTFLNSEDSGTNLVKGKQGILHILILLVIQQKNQKDCLKLEPNQTSAKPKRYEVRYLPDIRLTEVVSVAGVAELLELEVLVVLVAGEVLQDLQAVDHGVEPLAQGLQVGRVEQQEGKELAQHVAPACSLCGLLAFLFSYKKNCSYLIF